MKKFIQTVSIPLSGVMLGIAALGNLLQSYSEGVRYLCGIVATVLLVLLICKLCMFFDAVRDEMKNPIQASVAATFPMGVMLLAAYAKPFLGIVATGIWFAAIACHAVLIVYFIRQFILKLDLKKVFASYYIVFVGIAAASVTAPAFSMQGVGTVIFWIALVGYLPTLVLVSYRYLTIKQIPEPAQPLFCIYAAPASLCLAGYIQSVEQKSIGIITFLAVLSVVFYLMALVSLVKYLKMKFYPSYAAFTFPFVISAIAMKQTMSCLAKMERPLPAMNYLVQFQTIVAVVLVCYTLVRFMQAMIAQSKSLGK